jgi:hypothetical protein
MIKEAIDRILSLANGEIVEAVDGRQVWGKTGSPIEKPYVAPVATVKTLSALLSAFDGPELSNMNKDFLQVIIDDDHRVSVKSSADKIWKKRDTFIQAVYDSIEFPFGRQLDQEEFVIASQCLFSDGADKKAVIDFVSSIASEEVMQSEDDGVAQSVVTKTAAHGRKEAARVGPIVTLKPFRTFPDVDQPESQFLIRFTHRKGDLPLIALHGADGGKWRIQATKNIAEFLRAQLDDRGISVIG